MGDRKMADSVKFFILLGLVFGLFMIPFIVALIEEKKFELRRYKFMRTRKRILEEFDKNVEDFNKIKEKMKDLEDKDAV